MKKSDFILESKMAVKVKVKVKSKSKSTWKVKITGQILFLIGNTVAYWIVVLKV